jgi:hypothetical protein
VIDGGNRPTPYVLALVAEITHWLGKGGHDSGIGQITDDVDGGQTDFQLAADDVALGRKLPREDLQADFHAWVKSASSPYIDNPIPR